MYPGEEEVSTVFVAGFPFDAQHREIENLCRFIPGFETASISSGKGFSLFAKFDCARSAYAAVCSLNGQPFDRMLPNEPMRAEMAKSNMRSSPHSAFHGTDAGQPRHQQRSQAQSHGYSQGAYGGQHGGGWNALADQGHAGPPPGLKSQYQQGYNSSSERQAGSKRSWGNEGSAIDTVASVGAADVGLDEDALRNWFANQPGFLEFKGNARMGGGFAKFDSVAMAADAIAQATQEGVPAAFARTSMQSTAASRQDAPLTRWDQQQQSLDQSPMMPQQPQMHMLQWQYGSDEKQQADGAPAWQKRQRTHHEPLPDIDTVACVGALEAGFDEQMLQTFFSDVPGFVAFKPNSRMGGGFAKFSTVEQAIGAIQLAKETGIPISMAKSSMGSVPGSAPGSVPVSMPGSM